MLLMSFAAQSVFGDYLRQWAHSLMVFYHSRIPVLEITEKA
jgi:hypothetical protein